MTLSTLNSKVYEECQSIDREFNNLIDKLHADELDYVADMVQQAKEKAIQNLLAKIEGAH